MSLRSHCLDQRHGGLGGNTLSSSLLYPPFSRFLCVSVRESQAGAPST